MSQKRQNGHPEASAADAVAGTGAQPGEPDDLSVASLVAASQEPSGGASIAERFQGIRDRSSAFSQQLRREIEEYRAHVAKDFAQVHKTLIHLDRIMQVESRRREEMRQRLQQELLESVSAVNSELSEQLSTFDRSVSQSCDELNLAIASSTQGIEQERDDLEAAVREYREQASESVSAVARCLTAQRVSRMECLTSLNTRMQGDLGKTFDLMGENRMAREAALTKFSAQTDAMDKRYQAAAKGGVAALTTQCESLQNGLAAARNQRLFRHDELARTLATSFGGAQSDMGLLTQYYTEEG